MNKTNNTKEMEVTVKVSIPENWEPTEEELREMLVEDITCNVAAVADAFWRLAHLLEVNEVRELLSDLEDLQRAKRAEDALMILETLFVGARMKEAADMVNGARFIAENDPDDCDLFLELFFDDEKVDYFLVDMWLHEDEQNLSLEGPSDQEE